MLEFKLDRLKNENCTAFDLSSFTPGCRVGFGNIAGVDQVVEHGREVGEIHEIVAVVDDEQRIPAIGRVAGRQIDAHLAGLAERRAVDRDLLEAAGRGAARPPGRPGARSALFAPRSAPG